ncbi:carbohydrate-binding protein [Marinimicrobium sp. ARAG 43.8]|uniref:cellulase family glycosylhydrolase n=1 Tax=Marinimicrobium sp. ARAG 43.8 TaxID=3418719 RepID=UPI003CFB2EB3
MTLNVPAFGKAAACLGTVLLSSALLFGCGSSSNDRPPSNSSSSSDPSGTPDELSMLSTDGTRWVNADGDTVTLRGTNLGNWLLQEFWMMGQSTEAVDDQCTLEGIFDERFGVEERERLMTLFRDQWITERDWDQLAEFGMNVVRLPFLWNLIEDEHNPYTLRDDAWHYLDQAIAEAEARGMYVILDLHGAAGSQGWEHHSGCANRNWYWDGGNGEPASYYQDRTIWLWEHIAERYRDNETVAAYGLLNEPWGTTPETLADTITTLYHKVRDVDPNHIIILPGHSAGIDAYGHPADHDMVNVAFEMHFYPGIFGWGEIGYDVHRDWLTCGPDGTSGVCEWDTRLSELNTPFLIGEFQPWTGLGLEQGAQITRATYDTYAQYHWAATNWSYKVLSNTGGQGAGTWGMVTNQPGLGLLTKADTWACAGWDSDFDAACGTATPEFTVPGEGGQTYYLVIKAGACCGGTLDVSLDSLALRLAGSDTNLLVNGDFGSDEGWTLWTADADISVDFNADTRPTNGDGAALRLTGSSDTNGGLYQAVTLTGGETYHFDGLFSDNGSDSAWAEIYLAQEMPEDGTDITGAVLPQLNFHTAPLEDIEALFESFGTLEYDVHTPLKTWLNAEESPTLFDLPPTPEGLSLTTNGGQQLSWTAPDDDRITGYRIYRSAVELSVGSAIGEVQGTTFTDTGHATQKRHYRVSALADYAVSYPSEAVATEDVAVPALGRLRAEFYTDMSGIQLETTSDTGGGQNIGYIDAGDWLDYRVSVPAAGQYTIRYRVASEAGSDGFELLLEDEPLDTVAIPNTGGWQNWLTVTGTIDLPAGEHTLRVNALAGGWNFNWLEISEP